MDQPTTWDKYTVYMKNKCNFDLRTKCTFQNAPANDNDYTTLHIQSLLVVCTPPGPRSMTCRNHGHWPSYSTTIFPNQVHLISHSYQWTSSVIFHGEWWHATYRLRPNHPSNKNHRVHLSLSKATFKDVFTGWWQYPQSFFTCVPTLCTAIPMELGNYAHLPFGTYSSTHGDTTTKIFTGSSPIAQDSICQIQNINN